MSTNKLKLLAVFMVAIPLFALSNSALADQVTGTLTSGGGGSSESGNSNISGTVIVAPTANPAAGTYSSNQNVTLTAGGSSSIYYTMGQSAPTCSSGTLYSGAIAVTSTETIMAISCYPNNYSSSVVSFSYAIVPATIGGGGSSTVNGDGGNGITAQKPVVAVSNTATSAATSPSLPVTTQQTENNLPAAQVTVPQTNSGTVQQISQQQDQSSSSSTQQSSSSNNSSTVGTASLAGAGSKWFNYFAIALIVLIVIYAIYYFIRKKPGKPE